jgi:hypothetical protein
MKCLFVSVAESPGIDGWHERLAPAAGVPATAKESGFAVFFRLSLGRTATTAQNCGPLTDCNGAAIGIDQPKRSFGRSEPASGQRRDARADFPANRFLAGDGAESPTRHRL